MKPIYYVTTERELESASETGLISPQSFHEEGFVHCSFGHQLKGVIDNYFQNHQEVLVLEIDRTRLAAPVVEENLSGGDDLYPHIYGVLNLSAVVQRFPLTRRADGAFDWPSSLSL